MISVIARNKAEAEKNRYNAVSRVGVRFFESFAPFICGIELLTDHPEACRLWVDMESDAFEGFHTMLTAFINPWTGGQNTVEILKDDYAAWGEPRLK